MFRETTDYRSAIKPFSLSSRFGLKQRPNLTKGSGNYWIKSNDHSRVSSSGIIPLNIPLIAKHSFEVMVKNGDSEDLGSEALQIEAIHIIYMAISKHPDFVDRNWNEHTPTYQVLEWASDMLTLFCGDKYEWSYFIINGEESNLLIQSGYKSSDSYYGVNMYYLPLIEEEYPELFEPIIILLSILRHKCRILFWDSEADTMAFSSEDLEQVIEQNDEDDHEEIYSDYQNFHKEGKAYLKHIDNYKNSSSFDLEFYLDKVEAKTTWEQDCKVWLQLGLYLVKQEYKLWDFESDVHHDDDWPVYVHEWLKFDWNSGGQLFDHAYEYINAKWQESGSLDLCFQLDIKDPEMWQQERPEWPNELLNFMEKGIDLMTDFKTRPNAKTTRNT